MSVIATPDQLMLQTARQYAEAGWYVLPCHWNGAKAKAPLILHGHLDASRDPAMVERWWAMWPHALIGARVPETLIVLDIDPRNGGSLHALEEAAGPLPETLTAWSGRGDGGGHLYLRRPFGPLTSAGLPSGIDLKVSGYMILPPSLHPATGRPYRWEIREVAPLSPHLRELLRPSAPKRSVGHRWHGDGTPLVRFVADAPEGQRNQVLFWAACRAAEENTLEAIEGDLVGTAVSTGLPEIEARRTVLSAVRAVEMSR